MKTIDINTLFKEWGYNWEEHKDLLFEICRIANTRPGDTPHKLGNEQTFLIHATLKHAEAKKFFEVGTGRCKQTLHACTLPHMEDIITLDILKFDEKRPLSIGGQKTVASNKDLYEMFDYDKDKKEKISFLHPDDFKITDNIKNTFDVCFIDGDHHNEDVIYNDFKMSMQLIKKDGYIIFDDYNHPNLPAIKNVVSRVMDEYPDFDYTLVEQRGHIFTHEPKQKGEGIVLIKII